MHVVRVEARAVERGRHLDLSVDALLAQDRDPRARARGDVRRRDVVVRVEREPRRQFRDRRRRGCARTPRRRRPGCRAGAAWRASSTTTRDAGRCATSSSRTAIVAANADAVAACRSRRRSSPRGPRRAQREQGVRVAAAHLHDGAQLLGEQRRQRHRPSSVMSRPQRDANAISASATKRPPSAMS